MMQAKRNPTPLQGPQPSTEQPRINPSTKPHHLKKGLWNCPRCSAIFANEHDSGRAIDFKEVIEVQPLPRQPHKVESLVKVETFVKIEESKPQIKHTPAKRKVTAELVGPAGFIQVREVEGKWPCPAGCGATLGNASSASRHINSTACYNVLRQRDQPKTLLKTTREPVSARMQYRQLGISMPSDTTNALRDVSLQSNSMPKSNVNIKTTSDANEPSSITPVTSPSQGSPNQTSSILMVERDSASNITSITFLDKMNPRNPPPTEVYPFCPVSHNARPGVRAVRAILLNEIDISDPDAHAPTDSRLSLVSFLVQKLNFTTIIDHAQRRYNAQSQHNEREEDFRIRGIVAIHEYFGKPLPKTIQEGMAASGSNEEERDQVSTESTKQSSTQKIQLLDTPEPEPSRVDRCAKWFRRLAEDENEREAKRRKKDSIPVLSEPDGRKSSYPSPASRGRSQSRVDHDGTSFVFPQLTIPATLNSLHSLHREIMRCKRLLQTLREHLRSIKLDDPEQSSREVYLHAEIDDMEDRLRNAKEQLAENKELYRALIAENPSEMEMEICEKFVQEALSS